MGQSGTAPTTGAVLFIFPLYFSPPVKVPEGSPRRYSVKVMALTPPALLEALLFASSGPVSKKRLATMLEVTPALLGQAADVLRASLASRGIALIETDTELELRT